ncbi:signal peptidase I [Candidatus Woesearchaeota archaeon]|nr:signal peptidase I [Candidatus Woesearchaeota archaeon]
MDKKEMEKNLKKVWHFIWEDNSIWSWIVNIILAFILIKFVVYPFLGLVLITSHPVVAVVSGSMEHNGMELEQWWEKNKDWYLKNGIDKAAFEQFSLKNGFNKGDIMILVGKDGRNIKIGDVIVFVEGGKDPIIHRVVKKAERKGTIYFQTKGDNNRDSIKTSQLDETNIAETEVIGKAAFRVPLLGYIKIGFVEILKLAGIQ